MVFKLTTLSYFRHMLRFFKVEFLERLQYHKSKGLFEE